MLGAVTYIIYMGCNTRYLRLLPILKCRRSARYSLHAMTSSSYIRIYVVDDHRMFADGLMELLSSEADFKIVGRSPTAFDARRSLRDAHPDIVLLDVQLPDGDGYSVHEWLIETYDGDMPQVLYVTADDRLISINRAMSLGAMAYLDKTGGWEEVANAIRRAVAGSKTLGTNVAAKLAEYSFAPDAGKHQLSMRETEILTGISEGLTAKEIASQMGLALPTVRTYVGRLFKKLGARDRAHAVSIGYARGLIDSGSVDVVSTEP